MVEILPNRISATAGLPSLAAVTAVQIAGGHSTGLLQSFLMKRVTARWALKGGVDEEIILIGMARGDATVTEIKAALETTQVERNQKNQAAVRDVLFETLKIIRHEKDGGMAEIDVSIGGGKGIPFEDGDGWQWFAYNLDNDSLSAGAQEIMGQLCYYGVWL